MEEPDRLTHHKRQVHGQALNEFFKACVGFRKTDTSMEAMRFVGRFTDYAPINAFLIYTQRPTATFVATRSRWRSRFGRTLKEAARPIVILAPMSPVAFVYDLEDTDGKRIPKYYDEPYKVTGNLAKRNGTTPFSIALRLTNSG